MISFLLFIKWVFISYFLGPNYGPLFLDQIGNQGLCGKPLAPCKSSKKKILLIIAIIVVSIAAILCTIAAILFIRRRSAQSKQEARAQRKLKAQHHTAAMEVQLTADEDNYKEAEKGGELYFVRKDRGLSWKSC